MPLKHSRTTTETVPSRGALRKLKCGTETRQVIQIEEAKNFTTSEWRNKVLTDTRVRSKLKDQNYSVREIEDFELTRDSAQKLLQEKYNPDIRLAETPLSSGKDALLFVSLHTTYPSILVKVWNRPGKELMESKRHIWERHPDLVEEVTNCNPAQFQSFWAQREFQHLTKLRQAGVKCPEPLGCFKNILVLSFVYVSPMSEFNSYGDNLAYSNIVKSIRQLYMAGFVSLSLDTTNVDKNGVVMDSGNVVPRSDPEAVDLLFKNCQSISRHFEDKGLKAQGLNPIPSAEATYVMVTGFPFGASKVKVPVAKKYDDTDLENRKVERKSNRALLGEARKDKVKSDR